MASACCLTAIVFLVCCSTAIVGKRNATFQPRNNTVFERNKTEALNRTNNPTGCNLLVEKSKIEEILSKHDKSTTTNVVNLKVFIHPGNKTRYLQELEWASEIGRTIISLVRRIRDIPLFDSLLFTWTLEVGTKKVDIDVMEETDGCLPPGKEGTDQIFDFLLHKLSHSEDKHVFKLCRIHDDESFQYATYNCCRITGERNLTICADYSSLVVEWALPIIIVVFSVADLFVLPAVLQYITTYPTTMFYKTSESHMSLISLVSMVFCKGCGMFKSFFRRCVFASLILVLLFPMFFFSPWYGFLTLPLLFFLFCNVIQMTASKDKEECIRNQCKQGCTVEECNQKRAIENCNKKRTVDCDKKCTNTHEYDNKCKKNCWRPQWDTKIISCFTQPFLHYSEWWENIFENRENEQIRCDFNLFLLIMLIVFLPLIVIILFAVFLLNYFFFDLLYVFICPRHCSFKNLSKKDKCKVYIGLLFVCCLRLVVFFMSVFLTGMIFIVVLSTVVGLTLNAEFFNPFIAFVTTIILYFWKDWKSSVEGKCLQLKTLIIEVCNEISSENNSENSGGSNDIVNKNKNFFVQFDVYGEAMISIALYKEVEKIILPLNHLLFFFFRRVIFVGLYALCFLIVMIAFRESGVSESVQLISIIAGVMIPFIFNTIFADDHLPQKISWNTATKGKLKKMLSVESISKVEKNRIILNVINNVESEKDLEDEPKNCMCCC